MTKATPYVTLALGKIEAHCVASVLRGWARDRPHGSAVFVLYRQRLEHLAKHLEDGDDRPYTSRARCCPEKGI